MLVVLNWYSDNFETKNVPLMDIPDEYNSLKIQNNERGVLRCGVLTVAQKQIIAFVQYATVKLLKMCQVKYIGALIVVSQ